MHFPSRASKRALITTASTGVALSIGLAAGAGPASAHVRVDAENPAPGSTSVITFRVPGESETSAVTTQLSVKPPDVASARTEVMPGWTASLERDKAAGTVSSITWTANPQVGIPADQFALFRMSVKLPEGDSVTFPATQKMTAQAAPTADNAARWLAGGAIALAAMGVAAALIARSRT